MSKRAEEAGLKAYPEETRFIRDYNQLAKRQIYQQGYEQAEKDIWDRIEKYLKTRHHMNYATVGWILDNIEYYKQKIMEENNESK